MVFFGLGNIPFAPGRACDLVNVLGPPIHVPAANENPSDDDIHKFHEKYIEETRRIFHEYKATFGMENFSLRIE